MIQVHSITGRMIVGKIVGLVVGMGCMVVLPIFGFSLWSMFGLGTLLMFILMGVMIGLMGVFTHHPVFGFKMTWYIRGPIVGSAFMLMYVLLSYESIVVVMNSALLSWMGLQSPWWAILDGVAIGGVMGYLCTKISGEGPHLPVQ